MASQERLLVQLNSIVFGIWVSMTINRLSRIVAFRDYSGEGFVSSARDDMLEMISYNWSISVVGIEQPNITETSGNTPS